jgi:hypothetical protein
MKLVYVAGVVGVALIASGCEKKTEVVEKRMVAGSALSVQSASYSKPSYDAGHIDNVAVQALGMGGSPGEAIDDAIKIAIKQVNGVAVDMSSDKLRSVLVVAVGRDNAQLQTREFSDYVSNESRGVVTEFKVVSIDTPVGNNGLYKAQIEAKIAKFESAVNPNMLKIVVGPVHIDANAYKFAGVFVSADKVADEIRQQIINTLTNTGRFSVLDREFGADVEQELDMIALGQAPTAERSKLSQANSADLVWSGQINALNNGSWELSQRVINVATRQVQLSNILHGDSASALVQSEDSADKAKQKLEAQMVSSVVSAILVRTFPITVASRDGNNVVLSQGGQFVRENGRYRLVTMGQEIKDPQTGQSLGRIEYNCCEVVVDKVSPTMSQGHIENIKMPLDQIKSGDLQLRDLDANKTPEKVATSKTGKKGGKIQSKGVFDNDGAKW